MSKTIAPFFAGIWVFLAVSGRAADKPKADHRFAIAIERFAGGDGGNVDRFTVASDGSWEFKPQGGQSIKGKLTAADLSRWVKGIEDAGLYTVKSDTHRGGDDRSYMDITVQAKGKQTRVRIPLEEKLAQAIAKKIAELARPKS
jgi:hypothetical protein